MVAKKKPRATESEMRDMLERIRDLIGEYSNCPFCGSADFDLRTRKLKRGKHEDWCVYDALMEMKLDRLNGK